ncbi:MAG TPA: hypothetical protein VF209_04630 [Patescibacteria group bacterium]
MNKQLKIGDVIEIPLPNGKKAFAHYLAKDFWGDLIGVFDYLADINEKINLEQIETKKFKFPPVFTRIKDGMELSQLFTHFDEIIAAGLSLSEADIKMMSDKSTNYDWKVVGNIPIKDFTFPKFLWKEGGSHSLAPSMWYLYDGETDITIGKTIPQKYSDLEYKANYSPTSIVDRILTGEKPQEKLIKQSSSIFYGLLTKILK